MGYGQRALMVGLVVVLWMPATPVAQHTDQLLSAVVRIATDSGEGGSGFVVARTADSAVVVTASHVIDGAGPFDAYFEIEPRPRQAYTDTRILGIEFDDPNGLAVFEVRGGLPRGVTALPVEPGVSLDVGGSVTVVGYPRGAVSARVLSMLLSGREGNMLFLDAPFSPGVSGSPVIRDDRVVGVAMSTGERFGEAVAGSVLREFLEGYRVEVLADGVPGDAARRVPLTVPASGATSDALASFFADTSVLLVSLLSPGQTLGSAAADDPARGGHHAWASGVSQQQLTQALLDKVNLLLDQKLREGPVATGEFYAALCVSWAAYGVDFGSPAANSTDREMHDNWARVQPQGRLQNELENRVFKLVAALGP